jgi:hypothetical protein
MDPCVSYVVCVVCQVLVLKGFAGWVSSQNETVSVSQLKARSLSENETFFRKALILSSLSDCLICSVHLCCYVAVLLLLILCCNCYGFLCLLYVRLTVPHSCLRHEVRLRKVLTANTIGDASPWYFHLMHFSEWFFLLKASPGKCDPVGSQ